MTAKEYLRQIEVLNERFKSILLQIETLESETERTTAGYGSSGVHTGTSDRSAIYARLMELRKKANDAQDAYIDHKLRCMEIIARIPDGRYRDLLQLHYVDALSWSKVARKMSFSKDHLMLLHRNALGAFARARKITPNNTK